MIPEAVQRIWAPWRHTYIASASRRRRLACIFCSAKRAKNDRAAYVLYRGSSVFALLNCYPYTPGHLMVSPYRHVKRISEFTPQEAAELLLVTGRMEQALARAFHPSGFNVGANLGRPAGAGIPGHVHLHLVPRWVGDANFMTTFHNVRVLSQSLRDTYDRLTSCLR